MDPTSLLPPIVRLIPENQAPEELEPLDMEGQVEDSLPLINSLRDIAIEYSDKGCVHPNLILSMNDPSKIQMGVGGEQIFKMIAQAVQEAEDEVLIQTFTWDKKIHAVDWLNEALKAVAKRKLNQREFSGKLVKPLLVYILIDERGDMADFFFNKKLKRQHWDCTAESLGIFTQPGIVEVFPATFYHEGLDGNHAKTVTIDSRKVIITGANFQASNFHHQPAHDAALSIEGPAALAGRWDFVRMWNDPHKQSCSPSIALKQGDPYAQVETKPNFVPILFVSSVPQSLPSFTLYHPLTNVDNPIAQTFLNAISNAKSIIQIATPNLNEILILDELVSFINKRNGTVELLLGKGFNDSREVNIGMGGTNQSAVDYLFWRIDEDKWKNLKVRWFAKDGKPVIGNVAGACHLKFMRIDLILVIFGNANLDRISFENLHEDNIITDDPTLAKKMTESMFTVVYDQGVPAEPSQSKKKLLKEFLGISGYLGRLAEKEHLTILEVKEEGSGFRTIRLEKPEDWSFNPGQYVEITSGNPLSELCKNPAMLAIASGVHDPYIEVSARSSIFPWHRNHALRRGEGNTLHVTWPIGTCFPLKVVKADTPVLLLGGGSGLTALRSIIRSLSSHANLSLYYSSKTRNEILYQNEVDEWKKRGHVISLTREKVEGYSSGHITEILSNKEIHPHTIAFLCGPVSQVQALLKVLLAKGLPKEQIYASLPYDALKGGPVYRGDHPYFKNNE